MQGPKEGETDSTLPEAGTIRTDLLQILGDIRHQSAGWWEVASQEAQELPATVATVSA